MKRDGFIDPSILRRSVYYVTVKAVSNGNSRGSSPLFSWNLDAANLRRLRSSLQKAQKQRRCSERRFSPSRLQKTFGSEELDDLPFLRLHPPGFLLPGAFMVITVQVKYPVKY